MATYNYLLDKEFLNAIASEPIETLYINIGVLNKDEMRIGNIEGLATGGSITMNGASSIRRTGNLSLVADSTLYSITSINNLISIEKRIEIEIGIKNTISDQYPAIIWFPIGQFVIKTASISESAQGINISLSISDKMSLLNGELGGIIGGVTIFSPVYDVIEQKDGEPVLFRDLIYTLVSKNGGIPKEKILIEDVDLYVKNIVSWVGSNPVYITTAGTKAQVSLTGNDEDAHEQFADIGYVYERFAFPKELKAQPGEAITAPLEKIRSYLSNHEYFFDTNGVFHFRQIKNYLNEGSPQNVLTAAINDKYLKGAPAEKSVYTFANTKFTVNSTNSPQYSQVKNDIIVWGQSAKDSTPIRYHLAIDTPPKAIETKLENGKQVNIYGYWQVDFVEQKLVNRTIKRARTATRLTGNTGNCVTTDWRTELYFQYISNKTNNYKYYSLELEEEWPKVYDIKDGKYWEDDPAKLTYFFDMLDPAVIEDPVIKSMSVDKIGLRTKVIKDDSINCLFSANPLNVCIVKASEPNTATYRYLAYLDGAPFTQVSPEIAKYLQIGTAWNSAYDLIRSTLHEYVGYGETINISTKPIYFLEPNSRITVENSDLGISGDYIINTINLPLTLKGQMSISARRAVERF